MTERFDVVLQVLDGPQASMGEQKFQGPSVRLGSQPGPGGVALTGYRGVEARHAVITAYSENEPTIGPVGTCQVRLAPHPNVDWKQIDPLTGAAPLHRGAAIHLGPVGRGATLVLVRIERLGVWTQGRAGGAADSVQVAAGANRAASRRPAVVRIAAATLPVGVIGCLGLGVAVVAAGMLIAVYVRPADIDALAPVIDGEEFYEDVADPAVVLKNVKEEVLEGLQDPFLRFVAKPSADQARSAGRTDVEAITNPEEWDARYFAYTMASAKTHLQSRSFFARLEVVKEEYAQVLEALREAGLPDVLAAVPYAESRYDGAPQSWACAKGYWQFMPELAIQIQKRHGQDFRVEDCEIRTSGGDRVRWTPTDLAPPNRIRKNAPYIDKSAGPDSFDKGVCLIPAVDGCRRDDRTDLARSTQAAVRTLREAWDDPALGASGAAVAATILSHNAGYDDARFGVAKPYNVLPAYQTWSAAHADAHRFYGENIRTTSRKDPAPAWGGSPLTTESQHYAYTITGQHVIAVCYYAKNHANRFEVYQNYERFLQGYCDDLTIPTAAQAATW